MFTNFLDDYCWINYEKAHGSSDNYAKMRTRANLKRDFAPPIREFNYAAKLFFTVPLLAFMCSNSTTVHGESGRVPNDSFYVPRSSFNCDQVTIHRLPISSRLCFSFLRSLVLFIEELDEMTLNLHGGSDCIIDQSTVPCYLNNECM